MNIETVKQKLVDEIVFFQIKWEKNAYNKALLPVCTKYPSLTQLTHMYKKVPMCASYYLFIPVGTNFYHQVPFLLHVSITLY